MTNRRVRRPAAELREVFMVWLKIGCINFGGPAGQIALMHRVVVDERKWIDEPRFSACAQFLHAAAGTRSAKARDLPRLAVAWRAWWPERRDFVHRPRRRPPRSGSCTRSAARARPSPCDPPVAVVSDSNARRVTWASSSLWYAADSISKPTTHGRRSSPWTRAVSRPRSPIRILSAVATRRVPELSTGDSSSALPCGSVTVTAAVLSRSTASETAGRRRRRDHRCS